MCPLDSDVGADVRVGQIDNMLLGVVPVEVHTPDAPKLKGAEGLLMNVHKGTWI